MRQGQSAFLLVFAEKHKPTIAAHDSVAQKALLHRMFANDGWEAPEILNQMDATKDLYFDPISQIRMPRWTKGRVALVGDAAHSPSLLAGAGAAFAMLGSYILAGELHAADGDFECAFRAYEQRLSTVHSAPAEGGRWPCRFFHPKNRAWGLLARSRAQSDQRPDGGRVVAAADAGV